MARQIKSAAAAVEILGGVRSVAKLTSVTDQAVFNWISRGFPATKYVILTDAVDKLGYQLPVSLFSKMRKIA